ncbi:MAG: GINS complex subunit Sld5 [Pyrobaculum sp.]|nr:GINS complex subunit Sld5 [Pyrobaculum aerophilum]
MVFHSVINFHPVRVVFKRDVSLPSLGLSYQTNTVAEVPLFLALKLADMDAVEIDESYVISPKDVATLKYAEQRDNYPVKLPEGFYPRVRITIYLLGKKGDSKTVRAVIQEVRELLIERVRKIAMLIAARPELANDQSFLERLTPEEKALLTSMHNAITSFILSVI